MFGGLIVIAITAPARSLPASRSTDLSALLARVDGVDLAARELLVQSLVGLPVFAEAVVLCWVLVGC